MENSQNLQPSPIKPSVDMEINKQVGTTIVEQLGGNLFRHMVSAEFYLPADCYGLVVRFKGSKVANALHIKLNSMDTYDLTFMKVHGVKIKSVEGFFDVYFDQLQPLFTQVTGLATRF